MTGSIKSAFALITLALGLVSAAGPTKVSPSTSPSKASPLRQYEAEILVQVLPQAHYCRDTGNPTAIDLISVDEDFFHFWLYAKGPINGASPNIGYFAVNRHTADVWCEIPPKRQEAPELTIVQELVRKAHAIGFAELTKYGGTPEWAEGWSQ